MERLWEIWRSPYPFFTNRFRSICIASIIVALLMVVFQPFGIAHREIPYKTFFLMGFGVVTALALTFVNVCLPWCFPRAFQEKKWTLGKDVLRLMLCLLLIALGNWFYAAVMEGFQLSSGSFYFMLGCVLLLAPIPIIITLLWNRNIQLNKNLLEAQHMNELLTSIHESEKEITEPVETKVAEVPDKLILIGNLHKTLDFSPQDFLFVEAEGNYVKFHYSASGKERVQMLRATMSQVEEAISDLPEVVRCHRAFMVNINKVEKISGNAQGLRLSIPQSAEEVPVSRAHVSKIKNLLGNNL